MVPDTKEQELLTVRSRIASVPVPPEMAHLPRDKRGYPIPAIVFRDNKGEPHFTINDTGVNATALREDRCPICWGKLTRGRWFVGGPISALHENGAFGDPPGHRNCIAYALQVCPYLAAPSYTKRIDAETLIDRAGIGIALDPTVKSERPALFIAAMAIGQSVRWGPTVAIRPKRPYRAIEYWLHGRRIADETGREMAREALGGELPVFAGARLVVAQGKSR